MPDQSLEQHIAKILPPVRLKDVLNPLQFSRTHKILLLLTLGLGIFWNWTILKDLPSNIPHTQVVQEKSSSALPNLKKSPPAEEILALFRSRQLFKGFAVPLAPVPRAELPKGPSLAEKIRAFTLCGVLEENPVQALIEVKGSEQVYYVKEGEMLQDMEVASITPGQVVLKYQDETAVLR